MKSNHNGVSNPDREWVLEEKPGVFRRLKISDVPGVRFEGCNFPTEADIAIYEAEKAAAAEAAAAEAAQSLFDGPELELDEPELDTQSRVGWHTFALAA